MREWEEDGAKDSPGSSWWRRRLTPLRSRRSLYIPPLSESTRQKSLSLTPSAHLLLSLSPWALRPSLQAPRATEQRPTHNEPLLLTSKFKTVEKVIAIWGQGNTYLPGVQHLQIQTAAFRPNKVAQQNLATVVKHKIATMRGKWYSRERARFIISSQIVLAKRPIKFCCVETY